jgi:hypothetical protein
VTKPFVGAAVGALGLVLLLAAIWINFEVLTEAYGAGSPYYSRTTNMDKWTSPLPYLIPFDVVVLVLTALALHFSARSIRLHRSHRGA